jgi:hypothetical protein
VELPERKQPRTSEREIHEDLIRLAKSAIVLLQKWLDNETLIRDESVKKQP